MFSWLSTDQISGQANAKYITSLGASGGFLGLENNDKLIMTTVDRAIKWYFDGRYLVTEDGRPMKLRSQINTFTVSNAYDDITETFSIKVRIDTPFNTGQINLTLEKNYESSGGGYSNAGYLQASTSIVRAGALTFFPNPSQHMPNVDGSDPTLLWVTYDSAVYCCSNPNWIARPVECGNVFTPDGRQGACPGIMLDKCSKNWDTAECQTYLNNFQSIPDVSNVVQTTLLNYIKSRQPNDYCSKSLPHHQCGDPSRDDSSDPFFATTAPHLCGVAKGACDPVLDSYCSQFLKEDLASDPTLQTLCGCHLSTCVPNKNRGPNDPPCAPIPNPGIKFNNTITRANQYVYPDITIPCDPVCRYKNTIERSDMKPCSGTTCIMDHVTINQINSSGDISLDQMCGCKSGDCSCHINDLNINEINSQGKINIAQNCGQCFRFVDNDPSKEIRVDCKTFQPIEPMTSLEDLSPLLENMTREIYDKLNVIETEEEEYEKGHNRLVYLVILLLFAFIIFVIWRKKK